MSRVESGLLNLSEVIPSVLIELENTNLAKRELLLRPDVCQIEDVDLLLLPKFFSFLGSHCLPRDSPGRIFLTLNGLEEIFLRVIRRFFGGIFLCDELGALV